MHVIEVVLYVSSVILMWMMISKRAFKKQYVGVFLSVVIISFVIHLVFEGSRWQLYTLYVAVLMLGIVIYIRTILNTILNNVTKISIIVVSTLLIVVSGISAFVFPIYDLPEPSGEYLIGTESFIIEDDSRLELYSEDTEYRKIKIQMWYPAESTDGYEQVPWLEDGAVISKELSKNFGLPSFVLNHTENILSNSYSKAPISDDLENYPVVVISHGWTGFRNIHTDFAEELASLGYIVIGIDHTYGSVVTVFSDEDIAYLNLNALPDRETTPDFIDYAYQLVYTYAGDVTTTINYLEDINDISSASRFSGKLDLTSIGLLGHSTGGGGDVAVALNDDRIDAVIGLDAWVESIDATEISKGLSMPSLFLRSETWETGYNNTNLYAVIENSSYPSTLYQIDGTTHFDFAMVYMYSPLIKYIGFSGDIENEYMNDILKSMIADFFDNHLKNIENKEIDPNIWDEVKVISTE